MSTPRVHVHMTVSDLAKSRAFYETFLGVSPVKVKPGYVKFLPPWGPLNLALSDGRAAGEGHVNHMGVQLALRDDVMTQLQRVKAAGLPVREEFGVDCCHANQDKFWVEDPDGVEWEVYVLNHDLEDESPARKESLAPRSLPMAKATTCCAPGT